MDKKEIYKASIAKWGLDLQVDVAIEEMAELTKALKKYKRYRRNDEEVQEELADVLTMIEQLAFYFGEADVWKTQTGKLIRVLKMLAEPAQDGPGKGEL